MPPPERFATAPYSSLRLSAPAESASLTNWPSLGAGEGVILYSCGSSCAIARLAMPETVIDVEQPRSEVHLAYAAQQGILKVPKAIASIEMDQTSGGIDVAKVTAKMDLVTESGRVVVARDRQAIAEASSAGAVTAHVAQHSLQRHVNERSLRQTEETATTPATSTRIDQVMLAEGEKSATTFKEGGRLQSLKDLWSLELVTDNQLLTLLQDSHLMEGIYDTNELYLASDTFIISEREASDLLEILTHREDVRALVCRDMDERAPEGETGDCSAHVEIKVVAPPHPYHGHEVVLALSLKNTGTQSLTGATILFRVPAHAQFARFATPLTAKSGYLRVSIEDNSLLVWRLYRALPPGGSFSANFVLQTERWTP